MATDWSRPISRSEEHTSELQSPKIKSKLAEEAEVVSAEE